MLLSFLKPGVVILTLRSLQAAHHATKQELQLTTAELLKETKLVAELHVRLQLLYRSGTASSIANVQDCAFRKVLRN